MLSEAINMISKDTERDIVHFISGLLFGVGIGMVIGEFWL